MANEGAIIADSVVTALESARIQRQSGRLIVGQYVGGRFQEGEVYLQEGQPVYARLGQLVGQEALNQLLTWHNARATLYLHDPRYPTTQPGLTVDTGDRVAFLPTRQLGTRNTGSTPPQLQPSSSPGDASTNGAERLTPHKRQPERDISSLPLTRPQRFVYFLVDGRRTIADISRCTGKTVQEIDLILGALQAHGLVTI